MKRKIITTADGSTTIQIEDWNEQYHSVHGAIQEAYHVFIKNGLDLFDFGPISILEMGFGTGLNALITLIESQKKELQIEYTGVEAYPVSKDELKQLNYIEELDASVYLEQFASMHQSEWNKKSTITNAFHLTKLLLNFEELDFKEQFNLVYFDAFGPRVQPDLWTVSIFKKMYNAMMENGILVTYSAKGGVRRAMQEVGFVVERLPGPPGKREMLRAKKQVQSK